MTGPAEGSTRNYPATDVSGEGWLHRYGEAMTSADLVDPFSTGSTSDVVNDLLTRLLGVEGREDSLVGKIAVEIALDIIEERVSPGADLNSFELAKRFGTSRTPVREALMLLEKQGMVEVPPRRRPRATTFSPDTVSEIYELRGELYALVAQHIVAHAGDAELERLDQRLEAMRHAGRRGDHDGYFWQIVLFQEQCCVTAANDTLKRTIDTLGLRVLHLRHLGMDRGWQIERSLADHERLVQAFHERDAGLAAALNRTMARNALAGLMALFADGRFVRRPGEHD
ncbi:GntR family transcriptional regulator [Mycolicibacterium goodii]|uniref:GntR family transcriptional regulator n=1 Tax=Mycolicibacterium goodii TaxID=134601 RepID=UPI00138F54CC